MRSIYKLFFFEINEITLRCVVRLKPGHKVDFSSGELHEISGFESKIIYKDKTDIKYSINISKGIDRILIHSSLVENSYLNYVKSDVIYSSVPETSPGSLLTINPNPPIHLINFSSLHSMFDNKTPFECVVKLFFFGIKDRMGITFARRIAFLKIFNFHIVFFIP